MADTLTPNFGWTKPDPGGDANTWGATLNATTDKIDAQVFAGQTATSAAAAGVAPVGSITMFAGATPPTNWLNCDGSVISRTTYAALFAAIATKFGAGDGLTTFNLPNLQAKFPVGVGTGFALGATGGEATHTLVIGEVPAHLHGVSDPTHYHVVAAYTHTHGVNDPTHAHSVSDPTHAHSVGNQSQVPFAGTTGVAVAGTGSGSTGAAATGVSIQANHTGVSIQAAATGIPNTIAAATGVTTQNAGGGAAHNNLPPYVVLNFIIRCQ